MYTGTFRCCGYPDFAAARNRFYTASLTTCEDFGFSAARSWRQPELDRAKTGGSKIILIEESPTEMFQPFDSDQDNYTQNSAPNGEGRHSGFAITFADGHGSKAQKYDYSQVTYYTDRMSGWLGSGWTNDTNNVVTE